MNQVVRNRIDPALGVPGEWVGEILGGSVCGPGVEHDFCGGGKGDK